MKILRTLGIRQKFTYRTCHRYNETSSICDRKRSGRPRYVHILKAIKTVRERIRRSPVRKQLSEYRIESDFISEYRTKSCILNYDLGLALSIRDALVIS